MDNIVFKKIWSEDGMWDSNFLFEVKLTCVNENLMISKKYYMCNDNAKKIAKAIKKVLDKQKEQVVDFTYSSKKEKNIINGYSFKIMPADTHGHILIYVEMGKDNDCKNEYFNFTIETEIGLLESFGKKIEKLSKLRIDEEIRLNN